MIDLTPIAPNIQKRLFEKTQVLGRTEFPGQVVNRLWPALQNGRGADVWRHLFKQYSSPFTKKWNEKLFGRKPKKKTSRKRNIDEEILMKTLDLMQKT